MTVESPARTCPRCEANVAADARFCANCGLALEAAQPHVEAIQTRITAAAPDAEAPSAPNLGPTVDLTGVPMARSPVRTADKVKTEIGVPVFRGEDAKAKLEGALGGKAIEKSVPLEGYKQAVIDYIGSELASGAAVETHVIGHFVRLRGIYADHVVIDDPAQAGRAHKKVVWDEARAEGLFDKRIVLRP